MRVTGIQVTISEVFNLGNYSSTKPAITLTAELDANDDPVHELQRLIDMGTAAAQKKINAELKAQDEPPKYFDGVRWNIHRYSTSNHIVVVREAFDQHLVQEEIQSYVYGYQSLARGWPWADAVAIASEKKKESEEVVIIETEEELLAFCATRKAEEAEREAERKRIQEERERERQERHRQQEQEALARLARAVAPEDEYDEEDDDEE